MNPPTHFDLSLPYITEELEGIGGKIRAHPEDFIVEEIPLYTPTGRGSHLYVNITKRGQTTREVQLQLAELFNLKPQNIGTAGLKDKNAVTTQTFSVFLKNKNVEGALERIEGKLDVTVNWGKLHSNKLRAGHLIANKFKITITDIRAPIHQTYEKAAIIAEKINKHGLPNYYGEQRIGDAEKIRDGWAVIHGEKKYSDRWLSKLLIASYQSYLCNRYLAERVRLGYFDKLILGDIAKKHETGGIFWVNSVEEEQPRFDAKEISYTAPIYGYKMSHPLGESATLEEKIFEESGVTLTDLKQLNITGTRRFGRLTPDIEIAEVDRGFRLSFTLHKGGYATTVLREFMKNDGYVD